MLSQNIKKSLHLYNKTHLLFPQQISIQTKI